MLYSSSFLKKKTALLNFSWYIKSCTYLMNTMSLDIVQHQWYHLCNQDNRHTQHFSVFPCVSLFCLVGFVISILKMWSTFLINFEIHTTVLLTISTMLYSIPLKHIILHIWNFISKLCLTLPRSVSPGVLIILTDPIRPTVSESPWEGPGDCVLRELKCLGKYHFGGHHSSKEA